MRRSIIFIFTLAAALVFTQNSIYAISTRKIKFLTATELAQSLVGPGITISNVTYTGPIHNAGTFTDALADGLSIDSGVILSSGSINKAIGPNEDDAMSNDNDGIGDSDLKALVGETTYDAAILSFDFVPVAEYFSFLYIFASEEYNEYAGSEFNDVFAFFLDGKNIALIPLSEEAVSINNVNSDNNSEFYNNNDPGDLGTPTPYNTQFDGFTNILWAQGTVTPGKTYHIKLAIADVGDSQLNSAVFIASGSFSSTIPVIATSHSAYDFGGAGLGKTTAANFAVGNPGEGDLAISSIKITGASAGEFTITNSTCLNGILPAAQTCTFDVEFAPTTIGDKIANIQIISNALETPVINIALTGSAELFFALKTHNGAYLSAVDGGGGDVVATSYTYGPYERFSLRGLNNGKYALKTYNGNYVNALNGGGGNIVAMPMTNWGLLHSARGLFFINSCGGRLCWENFSLIDLGNYRVALQTMYGYYVTATGGGGGEVGAYGASMGAYEIFEIIYPE